MHISILGMGKTSIVRDLILIFILFLALTLAGCQESTQQSEPVEQTPPAKATLPAPEELEPVQPMAQEVPVEEVKVDVKIEPEPVAVQETPVAKDELKGDENEIVVAKVGIAVPVAESVEESPEIAVEDKEDAAAVEVATLDVVTADSAQSAEAEVDPNGIPKITSNTLVFDFGEIGVMTKNTATFEIVNEGTGELVISQISKCCGAVITINDIDNVTEESPLKLAPGQIAEVKAVYQAPGSAGKLKKDFTLISNDPATPALKLEIKGEVKVWVKCDPEQIRLSLREENAGFPPITVKALDDNPFSVTKLWSTDAAVSLEFDPNEKGTELTFQPKVDLDKLKDNPRGRIRFYLTREDLPAVECFYEVLKPYVTNPVTFLLFKTDPAEPIHKKLWVLDNYAQSGGYKANLEVESIKSVEYDIVRVISQRPLDDGVEFNLEITPPDPVAIKNHMFTDKLEIRIKDETEPIEVMIKGFYKASVIAKARKEFRDAPKTADRDQ